MTRYSLEIRQKAIELIEKGYGKQTIALELAIPKSVAIKWIYTYRAVGRKIFLDMGSKHRQYDYETKLAAVHDYVDLGIRSQEVMSKYGIVNLTQIKDWANAYREGGAEALKGKRRGRPRKIDGNPISPITREQELEVENRRLRAEVAYLKKLRALEAQKQAFGENAK